MDMYDSPDVSSFQAFLRKFACQHHSVVFFDHPFAGAGYAVICRGIIVPLPIIQIVRTIG